MAQFERSTNSNHQPLVEVILSSARDLRGTTIDPSARKPSPNSAPSFQRRWRFTLRATPHFSSDASLTTRILVACSSEFFLPAALSLLLAGCTQQRDSRPDPPGNGGSHGQVKDERQSCRSGSARRSEGGPAGRHQLCFQRRLAQAPWPDRRPSRPHHRRTPIHEYSRPRFSPHHRRSRVQPDQGKHRSQEVITGTCCNWGSARL